MSQDICNNLIADLSINAKGLKCPMPVIKLQQGIRTLQTGNVVKIDCTDLSAEKDITSWCKVNKHGLLGVIKTDFGITCCIEVFKFKTKPLLE